MSARTTQSEPEGSITVSVRLPPRLVHALKQAASDRRLTGREPNTQQAIVAAALELWLSTHNYLAQEASSE